MAEALALVASVIAVVQISGEVIGLCRSYIEAVHDAPFHHIFYELSTLKDVFESLERLVKSDKPLSLNLASLAGDDGAVAGCRECVSSLRDTMSPYAGGSSSVSQSKRGKVKDAFKALKWPLKEGKVKRLLEEISRHKASISLALASEAAYDVKNIDSKLDQLCVTNRSVEAQEILNWLSPVDHISQQSDFIARRQEGTGKWLLESTEFLEWVDTDKRTFFCPGIPGAGKTIMAATVIDELLKRRGANKSMGVGWLYCNFRQRDEQSCSKMLATLLRELSAQHDEVPTVVTDLYNLKKKKGNGLHLSVAEILGALRSVLEGFSRMFIVVDALDELADHSRDTLLSNLFDIQKHCNVNLFATSRPLSEISDKFKDSVTQEIRARDDDIQRYLDEYMPRLGKFVVQRPELQEETSRTIVEAVDGMFLLAQLHLKSLTGKRSAKTFKQALGRIATRSGGYDEAYNDVMERIFSQDEEYVTLAKDTLSWICFATRPLSVLELRQALAIEVGESQLDEDNMPETDTILSVCAGLVTIDEQSDVIRLVHYTTQEYLKQTSATWLPDAHAVIAKGCITYLAFDEFGLGELESLKLSPGNYDDKDIELYREIWRRRLYCYAAENWGYHSSAASSREITALCLSFLNNGSWATVAACALFGDPSFSYTEHTQSWPGSLPLVAAHPLQLAALYGLGDVVRSLLQHGDDANQCDSFGRTPLHYATLTGHASVVQDLIEAGADLNIRAPFYSPELDTSRYTPLQWAIKRGHNEVGQLLLDKGADFTEGPDAQGWTSPFHTAVNCGEVEFCRLLLERGAVISSNGERHGTHVLHDAASWGHCSVIQLLLALDDGGPVDVRDDHGWTPLHWAACGGRLEAAKLLVKHGADVNAVAMKGETVLSLAVESGERELVRFLIEHGANVNCTAHVAKPLLQRLGTWRDPAVMRCLLENGADIDELDFEGETALFRAVRLLQVGAVKVLCAAGANVNARNAHGQSVYEMLDEALPDRIARWKSQETYCRREHLRVSAVLLETHLAQQAARKGALKPLGKGIQRRRSWESDPDLDKGDWASEDCASESYALGQDHWRVRRRFSWESEQDWEQVRRRVLVSWGLKSGLESEWGEESEKSDEREEGEELR
ncbi:hypothetical protein B0T16DRAFT_195007 [Cercophora newfieldiana]|uniref:NACHT domain-containing protein n=1 Tax=Cercophora newfieldiana TaxID=92897 RepID=A0AA39Y1H8_9PEZI|nr:hypothetical protein B0T16DRAFT_195007 [Cercophora newfieldiana]